MMLKTANGKQVLRLSRTEWARIGKNAGWLSKTAENWIQEAVPESHKGKFESWCKKHGFKGVCQSCIDMALSENEDGSKKFPHAAKMANFAVNVPDSGYKNKKAASADVVTKIAAVMEELGIDEIKAVALLNWVAGAEVVPETSEGFTRIGGIRGIIKQLAMEPNFGRFALRAFDTAEIREKVIAQFLAGQNQQDQRETPYPSPE